MRGIGSAVVLYMRSRVCMYYVSMYFQIMPGTMEQIILELVTTHIVIKIVVLPGHGPRVEAPSVSVEANK